MLANGLLNLPIWAIILITLLLTHITLLGVTLYLHRSQAHRALDMHPAVNHFFRFWLWMTTGMSTKEWVSIHRKHHARCETEEDPHSPQIMGIKKIFWRGAEVYREAAADPVICEKYGHGTPSDWLENNLYGRWQSLGIALMLIIDLLLFGVLGLTIWAVQMVLIPLLAAGVINGIGHYWGYRNYETKDAATNILPWGLFIGGEELHNNHHAFPSSAKFSCKPWEFDIGWMYIRLLSALKLAKVRRMAPTPHHDFDKKAIDLDTLRAVITNRLHVTADFARNVVIPVLQDEWHKADSATRRFLKKSRRPLIREDARLNDGQRSQLQHVLNSNNQLRTVYEYRQQLQEIWARTSLNHDKLIAALQEWCTRAEASGNRYLQDFSARLRSYTLQPV